MALVQGGELGYANNNSWFMYWSNRFSSSQKLKLKEGQLCPIIKGLHRCGNLPKTKQNKKNTLDVCTHPLNKINNEFLKVFFEKARARKRSFILERDYSFLGAVASWNCFCFACGSQVQFSAFADGAGNNSCVKLWRAQSCCQPMLTILC